MIARISQPVREPPWKSWVALLRGVNVGGRGLVRMKDLVLQLEGEGLRDVRSHLNSGNLVFRAQGATAKSLAARIGGRILASHGFEPRVIVLGERDLARAIAANPFPAAEESPAALHLFFLWGPPASPDLAALERIRTGGESFALEGKVFYLWTPDGLGRSRLGAQVERHLGVDATARNWRTAGSLLAMARGER